MWSAQYYTYTNPRTLLTSGGLGTMGYGFPAAIGAKLGLSDRNVVCISGDGSFADEYTGTEYCCRIIKCLLRLPFLTTGFLEW